MATTEGYVPGGILITGGAGFIASHVCNRLVEVYPDIWIICLDVMEYCANERNIGPALATPKFKLVKGSILNHELIMLLFEEYGIDTVMHFAALSHVDRSFGNSLEFTNVNVVGTHTILECCRYYGKIRRIIHVSSDEVYGEIKEGAASEATILAPTNPYAATKAAAEQICQAYIRSFHLPVIITRGNNVFGPHQFPEKVIPRFVYQLESGRKATIHGNGSGTRNFVHTTDVVKAFELVLRKGELNVIYNIGSPIETSILELGLKIAKIMGKPDPENWIVHCEDRPFNDCRYFVDCQRLHDLGWTPDQDFDRLLAETVDWYLQHKDWWAQVDFAPMLGVAHPFKVPRQ